MTYSKTIAEEHWKWIEGFLSELGYQDISGFEYLYRTAFEHGWKHAMESIDTKQQQIVKGKAMKDGGRIGNKDNM